MYYNLKSIKSNLGHFCTNILEMKKLREISQMEKRGGIMSTLLGMQFYLQCQQKVKWIFFESRIEKLQFFIEI